MRLAVLAASIAYMATVIANTVRIPSAPVAPDRLGRDRCLHGCQASSHRRFVVYFVMCTLLLECVRKLLAAERGNALAGELSLFA